MTGKESGMTLEDHFHYGMQQPYGPYPEKELLADACKCVAVFVSADARIGNLARSVAVHNAGSFIAAISEGKIKKTITGILLKCCELKATETLSLTPKEKRFLKAGIEGTLYQQFYE